MFYCIHFLLLIVFTANLICILLSFIMFSEVYKNWTGRLLYFLFMFNLLKRSSLQDLVVSSNEVSDCNQVNIPRLTPLMVAKKNPLLIQRWVSSFLMVTVTEIAVQHAGLYIFLLFHFFLLNPPHWIFNIFFCFHHLQ